MEGYYSRFLKETLFRIFQFKNRLNSVFFIKVVNNNCARISLDLDCANKIFKSFQENFSR